MLTINQDLDGYLTKSNQIFDMCLNNATYPSQCINIYEHWDGALTAITLNPDENLSMLWSRYNTRYGYVNSICGVTSECIAAINLVTLTNHSIIISETEEDQAGSAIDFWICSAGMIQTVQVKTIRLINSKICNTINISNLKTTWTSLVDIESCIHYLINTNTLIDLLKKESCPRDSQLESVSTHVFNNILLYGSKEDRLIYQLSQK